MYIWLTIWWIHNVLCRYTVYFLTKEVLIGQCKSNLIKIQILQLGWIQTRDNYHALWQEQLSFRSYKDRYKIYNHIQSSLLENLLHIALVDVCGSCCSKWKKTISHKTVGATWPWKWDAFSMVCFEQSIYISLQTTRMKN